MTLALATAVVSKLRAAGFSIGTAESLTGGLVCAALTDVPGASTVVRGGVVAYATDLKARVLGVDAQLLARVGAVDPEVARQLAAGASRVLGAAIGVATTGVAGPDPQDGVEVGVVFIAVAGAVSGERREHFTGDRDAIRHATVRSALELLDELL